jgi:hypothetical protein
MFIWTVGNVLEAFTIGVVLVWYLSTSIAEWLKQTRCKHNRVHETRACDAICMSCGKNLGFIGTWREKRGA